MGRREISTEIGRRTYIPSLTDFLVGMTPMGSLHFVQLRRKVRIPKG